MKDDVRFRASCGDLHRNAKEIIWVASRMNVLLQLLEYELLQTLDIGLLRRETYMHQILSCSLDMFQVLDRDVLGIQVYENVLELFC